MAKKTDPAPAAPDMTRDELAEAYPDLIESEVRVHRPSAEQVRIECLKLAMDMRNTLTGTRAVIINAKEFETYVTGAAAEPDAAPDAA
jgi:hypothetical protein